MIDTHSHLFFSEFYDQKLEPEILLSASAAAGVQSIITVSTTLGQLELIREVNSLARKHKINAYYSIGVHPHDAKDFETYQCRDVLISAQKNEDGLVAIGECGLDFYKNFNSQDLQEAVLGGQLALAREFNLPAIFHIRNAFAAFWRIYDSFGPLSGVVHSFTGEAKDAQEALARKLKIGVNGIITFPNAEKLRTVLVQNIPISALVLETDTPFLSPQPLRGKINSPANIRIIAQALAELYQVDIEDVIANTNNSAEELFRLHSAVV